MSWPPSMDEEWGRLLVCLAATFALSVPLYIFLSAALGVSGGVAALLSNMAAAPVGLMLANRLYPQS